MTYALHQLLQIHRRVNMALKVSTIKRQEFQSNLLQRRLSELDDAISILSEYDNPRVESLAKEMDDNYFE